MIVFLSGLSLLVICGFIKLALFNKMSSSATSSNQTLPPSDIINTTDAINTTDPDRGVPFLNVTSSDAIDYAHLPVTVFLSILGFTMLDIGFDLSISITRALIVDITPPSQQTRLLITATVAQSMAGTIFSLIGCFDMPHILEGFFHVEGVAATLLFFCFLLLVVVSLCYISTISTGYFLQRRQTAPQSLKHPPLIDSDKTFKVPKKTKEVKKTWKRMYNPGDKEELKKPLLPKEDTDSYSAIKHLHQGSFSENESKQPYVQEVSEMAPFAKTHLSQKPFEEFHSKKLDRTEYHGEKISSTRTISSSTKKIALLVVATFFAIGSAMCFAVYAANTLTVGIYKGEPTALPGTPGYDRYEYGLRKSAQGNLMHYVTYMAVSVCNKKIIDILGEWVCVCVCV